MPVSVPSMTHSAKNAAYVAIAKVKGAANGPKRCSRGIAAHISPSSPLTAATGHRLLSKACDRPKPDVRRAEHQTVTLSTRSRRATLFRVAFSAETDVGEQAHTSLVAENGAAAS